MILKELSSNNIEILNDNISVVLAYSDTCPDCGPAKKFLTEEVEGYNNNISGINFYQLDFDLEIDLCDSFEIYQVPQYIFVVNGKKVSNLWTLQEPITLNSWILANFNKYK